MQMGVLFENLLHKNDGHLAKQINLNRGCSSEKPSNTTTQNTSIGSSQCNTQPTSSAPLTTNLCQQKRARQWQNLKKVRPTIRQKYIKWFQGEKEEVISALKSIVAAAWHTAGVNYSSTIIQTPIHNNTNLICCSSTRCGRLAKSNIGYGTICRKDANCSRTMLREWHYLWWHILKMIYFQILIKNNYDINGTQENKSSKQLPFSLGCQYVVLSLSIVRISGPFPNPPVVQQKT